MNRRGTSKMKRAVAESPRRGGFWCENDYPRMEEIQRRDGKQTRSEDNRRAAEVIRGKRNPLSVVRIGEFLRDRNQFPILGPFTAKFPFSPLCLSGSAVILFVITTHSRR